MVLLNGLMSFQAFASAISTTSTTAHPDKDPYGKWNSGDMKLTAVPFSRSADGSRRKWVLMTK